MPDDNRPLVSVVTVNYNDAELTGALLESLRHQTWENLEVVVVDNASHDDSVAELRRRFPEVRILEQEVNGGFAGGNNAGIRAARGSLIALANNDTVATPTWLEEMVATVQADAEVGAVASKVLFLRRFLEVRCEVVDEAGPVFVGEDSHFEGCDYRKPVFRQGFDCPHELAAGVVWRVTGAGLLYLPVPDADGPLTLELGTVAKTPQRRLRVAVGGPDHGQEHELGVVEVGEEARTDRFEIPASVAADAVSLINNAGTRLSARGDAADRGIFEPDRGQYDTVEDVESVCGAAVLFRRSALQEVGIFDRDFFLYYEDTDLSWRLRKAGWRLRYQPASVIRHVHAASSVEWSPLFIFHTARNRVLMIAKNSTFGAFAEAYLREWRSLAVALFRAVRGPGSGTRRHFRRELATRARVHASLLWQIPRAFLKRAGVLRH